MESRRRCGFLLLGTVGFLVVVLGIIAHWVWEILVAGLPTGEFEFGTLGVILARVVIAFIAGAWSFAGIWGQLSGVDKKLRLFVAFTQGFAVEALTGPVVNTVTPAP